MSNVRTKRIAIIGAGAHATAHHYPALHYVDEIEFCAACDLSTEKLEAVQKQYQIPAVYTDYREMIQKESPDAVVVVLRPMDMVDVVLGCLELGVHLMIEKPPGCNSDDARRMLDRAEHKGCKVMVSLNRRFMPLVRELKVMALDRKLVYCSATYNKDGFFDKKWTWPSPLPVADAIHLIDLMRFVAGDVAEVYAASAKREAEFTNAHSATLVFESGAMGTINTHHCVGFRVHRFELHAHNMSAYMDVGNTHEPSCELFLDGQSAETPVFHTDLPKGVGLDAYHETIHFARFAAGEEEGESVLADAIESVRLAEAVANGHRGPMSKLC